MSHYLTVLPQNSKHFKDGDLSLEIKHQNGQSSVVNYDALKHVRGEP